MLRAFLRSLSIAGVMTLASVPASAIAAEDNPDLEKLTEEQIDEFAEFVVGNSIFILFHEAGHMLVSEFNLPVLGREEDAVDALSAILMLEADDETFDNAIMDSADGWFLSGEATAAAEQEEVLWGAHGIDEQRAWAIVCLMAGHNYSDFEEFIDSIDFPEDRKEECKTEYRQKLTGWFSLLGPHEAKKGGKTKFITRYETVKDKDLELYADMIREGDLLSIVSETFSGLYALEDGIKLTAKSCGEANAFWSADDREITLCYEFAQFYGKLVANYFLENGDADSEETTEKEQVAAPRRKQ